ncbi:MAG: hypothetical protein V3T83_17160 [Acidobacteriota bacterium]
MAGRKAASRFAAFFLLTAAVALFYLTVWSLDPASTSQASLSAWPDAAEYLDGALQLANQGQFRIHVAGQEWPSRYPFGMSLLQAGLLKLGVQPLQAPYLLNKAAGLLLLLSVFAVMAWRGHLLAGGLAALLLSTRTSFIILSRSPMSEIVTMLAVFWALAALYRYSQGGALWMGLAGTCLLSLTTGFRLSSILLFGFPAAALMAQAKWDARAILGQGWRLAAAGLAGLAPVLIYQWTVFGAAWKTGYGYWLNRGGDLDIMFGSRYLGRNLNRLWEEFVQDESMGSVASLFGEGSYYAPAYALFCLLSAAVIWKRPAARWFGAAALIFTAMVLFYSFGTGRQYFPLLVLSVPWTAYAWTRFCNRALEERRWIRTSFASVFLLTVLVGWPGSRSDSDMGDMFRTLPLQVPSWPYRAASLMVAQGPDAKLLLTEMNPTYLHAMTCCRHWVAPLQNEHDYRHNPQNLIFGDAERDQLIQEAMQQGREVYAATAYYPIERLDKACAAPQGMVWQVFWHNRVGGGLAQLVRVSRQGPAQK